MTSDVITATYAAAPNRHVTSANGVDYAYRDVGQGAVPLILLQHFRGNLDNWDPALVDELAAHRRVIAFDNVGVGATTGRTPSTFDQMAHGAIEFLDAMNVDLVDLLGFSIGSFVAQEIALTRPQSVRRLILASSAPKGARGMHGWAPAVMAAVGGQQSNPEGYRDVFYTKSEASRQAGERSLRRIFGRTTDRDSATTWETRLAQYDAVCAWGIPNHALFERLSAISMPTFIAYGDSDPMILPRYSELLAVLIPDARVQVYRDSAHGFLFQNYIDFAADVEAFLS